MTKVIHVISKSNEKINLPKGINHIIEETDELIIITTIIEDARNI